MLTLKSLRGEKLKALLIRPKIKKNMGVLNFVNVEPLELEYLAGILKEEKWEYQIYDGSISKKDFKKEYKENDFDIAFFSPYINGIDVVKEYAKYLKEVNKEIKVIVGGVVAEVVPHLLFSPYIDIIVHSGGFLPVEKLILGNFKEDILPYIKGISYRVKEKFIENEKQVFHINSLPHIDRSHFYENSKKFKYLNYKKVALMKTAYSCPYDCNFCYCRKLNNGKYVTLNMESIIKEIKEIKVDNIWIVDDTFLFSRGKAIEFIEEINKNGIKKRFIIYARADFIDRNYDLLKDLKEAGIVMIIVGLESVEDKDLEYFNKKTNNDINKNSVKYLNESGIECMGLFIAGIDYKIEDFKRLRRWIKEMDLKKYTISIFTPLPGTSLFEKWEKNLIAKDYKKYNFLNLVIKPIYLRKSCFYFQLYISYLPYISSYFKEKFRKR